MTDYAACHCCLTFMVVPPNWVHLVVTGDVTVGVNALISPLRSCSERFCFVSLFCFVLFDVCLAGWLVLFCFVFNKNSFDTLVVYCSIWVLFVDCHTCGRTKRYPRAPKPYALSEVFRHFLSMESDLLIHNCFHVPCLNARGAAMTDCIGAVLNRFTLLPWLLLLAPPIKNQNTLSKRFSTQLFIQCHRIANVRSYFWACCQLYSYSSHWLVQLDTT